MSRFETLVSTVSHYQRLAAENYTRVRSLADELRAGLCAYLESNDGICVRLVPPAGPFEPKDYGDHSFSIPPAGFRPLGPILFGLAIRVSHDADWMRVTMECQKIGETFVTRISGGEEYKLTIPLAEHDPEPFYQHIYDHVADWFQTQIDRYEAGDYGGREIGFDFSMPETEEQASA
ncbi:MAG: hypothetical protein GYB42_05775 [Alphaproteobacteria bacterium]|nr:hypothetical protein [Alphaproteobacteria bacterium]